MSPKCIYIIYSNMGRNVLERLKYKSENLPNPWLTINHNILVNWFVSLNINLGIFFSGVGIYK